MSELKSGSAARSSAFCLQCLRMTTLRFRQTPSNLIEPNRLICVAATFAESTRSMPSARRKFQCGISAGCFAAKRREWQREMTVNLPIFGTTVIAASVLRLAVCRGVRSAPVGRDVLKVLVQRVSYSALNDAPKVSRLYLHRTRYSLFEAQSL